MARSAKPWYAADKGCYWAYVNGRRLILLKGEDNPTNAKLAARKLRQIVAASQKDGPSSGLQVADIIDRYLALHREKYSPRAYEERQRYLQLFAEAHGFRKVTDRDCLPVQVEEWIAEHPPWQSDWTRAQITAIILRPFNWAAKKRPIAANPFRGVEKGRGRHAAPRPMTNSRPCCGRAGITRRSRAQGRYPSGRKVCPSDRKRRAHPSPAARFRMVLVALRYTGMRPGELRNLEWPAVDLQAAELVLRRHKTSKKTGRVRRIPLHPVVVKLLTHLRKVNEPGTHVFLSQRKKPWHRVSLAQKLRRVRQAAFLFRSACVGSAALRASHKSHAEAAEIRPESSWSRGFRLQLPPELKPRPKTGSRTYRRDAVRRSVEALGIEVSAELLELRRYWRHVALDDLLPHQPQACARGTKTLMSSLSIASAAKAGKTGPNTTF